MSKTKFLDFDILNEEISPNNILAMSECIAFSEVRFVNNRTGGKLKRMYSDIYADILNRNNPNYRFSDSYDFVQTAALFLCEHFGKHLSDIMFYDKKGKAITLKILCCRQVIRDIDHWNTTYKRNTSLEDLLPKQVPVIEMKEEVTEEDYTQCDKIVDSLNLTENMRIALNCRMSDLSYPEIGRILERNQATVYEYFIKMRQRYMKIYG